MKNNYLSVLEVSKKLGFTKNAVKYHLKKLPPEMLEKDENNRIFISPEGVELLRGKMGEKGPEQIQETHQDKEPGKTDNLPAKVEAPLYDSLLTTVETLREQLAQKDAQLNASNAEKATLLQLLNQQQQLTAGQIAQINKYIEAHDETATSKEPEKRGFFSGIFGAKK